MPRRATRPRLTRGLWRLAGLTAVAVTLTVPAAALSLGGRADAVATAATGPPAAHGADLQWWGAEVPDVIALGLGVLASAALIRCARRSRRLARAGRTAIAGAGGVDHAVTAAEPTVAPLPAAAPGPHAGAPGPVEVKLLTMTPRIEGMVEPLPPNRARRAVELVAYLALHRPDVVTSDRLRTRVLGTSDADAASKTLFNVATAARRSLGTDGEGAMLLPPGTRSGYYSLSPAVTVDVQRAAVLATVGSATADPEQAMAHLRHALSLVEGEPLANALSGYTWWESEGHGARMAAVLVNAACNLAALAVDAGRYDLAQWGLEQARLVEPYSEAITRACMQVAAAAGDADRLRREWRECQRRIADLDPGSSPSPRTERLYGELAQRVLVGSGGAHPG